MPAKERFKAGYPGVYYILGKRVKGAKGKPQEKVYYIYYRKDGKKIEEKVGREFQDDMTPARAAVIRAQRIEGEELSNKERRIEEQKRKQAESDKWTIRNLWKEYKSLKDGFSKGIQTDGYRYVKHLDSVLGDKEPSEIVIEDVDRLYVGLSQTHSSQSVKHVLSLLKRIVNFGIKRKLCLPIPFKVEVPMVDNVKTEDLTTDQLRSLLKAIKDSPDREAADLMSLALFTGMRRGELFKLQWKDIDFERGFITIRNPKGGRSQTIPMNARAISILNDRAPIEKNGSESKYIFTPGDGKPFKDIRRRVNPIAKAAGLPADFRPLHGLRHVYASMLASSGKVDMYTLQRLLTHKSPIMTQRYSHLRDDSLRKATDLAVDIVKDVVAQGTK